VTQKVFLEAACDSEKLFPKSRENLPVPEMECQQRNYDAILWIFEQIFGIDKSFKRSTQNFLFLLFLFSY
jgi:hypothetical protein